MESSNLIVLLLLLVIFHSDVEKERNFIVQTQSQNVTNWSQKLVLDIRA